jgi:histidine ammonia-lyase
MKSLILGIIVVGVVVIITYKVINEHHSETTKKSDAKSSEAESESKSSKKPAPLSKQPAVANDEDITDQKTCAAAIISERHEKAEVIIAEALKNILNEDNKKDDVAVSENESDFNDMFSNLDKLSK